MVKQFRMLIILSCILYCNSFTVSTGQEPKCRLKGIAKYNLTFEGHWSEEDFPKQYPLFRPNAQWSKVVGRTHSDDYSLWQMGSTASQGLKELVEKGLTQELDKVDIQGRKGILDLFYSEAISVGVGETWVTFFADQDHPKLSMASKIIPSPDWFVGLDSLNLCEDGQWITAKEIELGPIDAGTDKGFTFTSPNWSESPFKPIFQITSQFPSHPANSFYYSLKEKLPLLAKVVIQRLDVFEQVGKDESVTVDEVNIYTDKDGVDTDANTKYVNLVDELSTYDDPITNEHTETKHNPNSEAYQESSVYHKTDLNEISQTFGIEAKENKYDSRLKEHGIQWGKVVTTASNERVTDVLKKSENRDKEGEPLMAEGRLPSLDSKISKSVLQDIAVTERTVEKQDTAPEDVKSPVIEGRGRDIVDNSLVRDNQHRTLSPTEQPLNDYVPEKRPSKKRKQRKNKRKQRKRKRNRKAKLLKEKAVKPTEKVNCLLGEWAPWSACSVTCGYGEMTRLRQVIQEPKNGGAECEQQPQQSLCGSMRNCENWKHFSFENWGNLI